MIRTHKDILILFFTKLAGPEEGKQLMQQFIAEVIPNLPVRNLHEEVTETYYQECKAGLEREVPLFARWLIQYKPPGQASAFWEALKTKVRQN